MSITTITAPPAIAATFDETTGEFRGPVRLRTLTTLRWLAVVGQTAAISIVHFGFGFPLELGLCLGVIAASAWLNIFATMRFSPQRILSDGEATAYILFDILQLCGLLALTGGLLNPFSILILAPVTIAASVLPLRSTAVIAALAVIGVSVLTSVHLPLPWRGGEDIALPVIYKAGVWAALSFSVIFFSVYAHRIAAESAQMKSALAATQLVLAREQRLDAVGGLAAAAAHELGTPLATIQVTAKEMARDLDRESGVDPHLKDDALLLVSQAERCRDILGRLSTRGEASDAMMENLAVDALLREAAAPFVDDKGGGPAIIFEIIPSEDAKTTLILRRQPEILYGLRNVIENAVEFALSRVLLTAQWDNETLSISIHDDGGGFPSDVLARLGEPYLETRGSRAAKTGAKGWAGRKKPGMGLGFFISKTLLERTGAEISFDNQHWSEDASLSGAWVRVRWPLRMIARQTP
ncbi:MAG: ActS/PrrB/RegB family redox-sensitive histidine kinase [Pseudomonadota bacterium]